MTLQFNPEAYNQINQQRSAREQQSKQILADSLNRIPQAFIGYAQQKQDKARQDQQDQLSRIMMGMKAGEAGYDPQTFMSGLPGAPGATQAPPQPTAMQRFFKSVPLTDPTNPDVQGLPQGYSYNPSGPSQNGSGMPGLPPIGGSGPTQADMSESSLPGGMPSTNTPPLRPGSGQFAGAGVSDTPSPMPQQPSLGGVGSMGAPQPAPKPLFGGMQGQGAPSAGLPPMGQPATPSGSAAAPLSMWTKPNVDFNGVMDGMKKGDYSAFNKLNEKQKGDLKELPAFKLMGEKPDKTPSAYSAADLADAEKGNWQAIAQRNGGTIPASLATLGESASSRNFNMGEKQNQFDQKEWDKIVKETDATSASGRTGLGMAVKADYNANRALMTLSKPTVTNQEAANVMADIAQIYQGGSATQYGMSHQGYDTLYQKIMGGVQSLTGKPQDSLPDAIKQRLIGVLNDMKGTNRAVMKQQLDHYEVSQPKLIGKYKNEWQGIRSNLEGGIGGGPDNGGGPGLMWQGRPLKDTPANRAWLQQQGTAQ